MAIPKLTVAVRTEVWPIAGTFTISRGSRTEVSVVVVEISDGTCTGRGECVPYPRYGETVEAVTAQIAAASITSLDREELRRHMAPGAARNGLDCALWDLEAKATGVSAAARAGIKMQPLTTAFTLSLGTPGDMEAAARAAGDRPLLKLKLGGDGDVDRVHAVRRGAPRSRLVVDANEAWREANFAANMLACVEAGVTLIEQPLPAGQDELLRTLPHPVPICADESSHSRADLDQVAGKYDAINIKLDKAGGLTEALDLAREARRRGYLVMVGCMLGTSLAMAPALLVAQQADVVDLDGPLLLARDRQHPLAFRGSEVSPASPELWG